MEGQKTEIPFHHIKQEVCITRKAYRDGRHSKAVKVYTVNNESKYILIQGVPSVGATDNLVSLCSKFGDVEEHHALDDYPCDDKFTEVYLIKYKKIQSARFAKRKLDDYSFFGGNLHVCYSPEHETVSETREKLLDRRRIVSHKIRQHEQEQKQLEAKEREKEVISGISDISSDSREFDTTKEGAMNSYPLAIENKQADSYNHLQSINQNTPNLYADNSHVPLHSNAKHPDSRTYIASSSSCAKSNAWNNSYKGHNGHRIMYNRISTTAPSPNNDSVATDQCLESESIFELPLPPQASNFIPHSVRGRQRYEFSRTQSAHATLPAGFDGRLNPPTFSNPETKHQSSNPLTSIPGSELSQLNKSVHTVHTKLDISTVVVKEYKHSGPAPKFVPRQTVKRKASDISSGGKTAGKKPDKLDQEIKRNAFQLGKAQGPQNSADAETRPAVSLALAKSVNQTIHNIRDQISKVIKNTVSKQT